jgi:argininosuccinate lyase
MAEKTAAFPRTLWSQSASDQVMLAYTAGPDQQWDGRLLHWDILGSLGHVAGLAASGVITAASHRKLQAALRSALRAADAGRLRFTPKDEDVHTAVENWLVRRDKRIGEMVHTGRSRNDQVCCDLRLYLKDRLLDLHAGGRAVVAELLAFARREQRSIWPGYTHTRRAMPSSAALWAGGIAEGLLDSLTTLEATWVQVDRSPLGSAAGYGVPLPIKREATAKALGFAGIDHVVTSTQNSRGRTEAAVVFWCAQLAHDLSRLAGDVILWSAEEYGYLELPASFVTGSSIMPHKRNPDLFELTRARAAQIDGDLAAVLAVRAKPTSGYQRDYQLLKAPLMGALDRTGEMLGMLARVLPGLTVNRKRAAAAVTGDLLATDEVMRRVEEGIPFRTAYRDVAKELRSKAALRVPSRSGIFARRRSTGGLGNPGLSMLLSRNRARERWESRERKRFSAAMRRLATGRRG